MKLRQRAQKWMRRHPDSNNATAKAPWRRRRLRTWVVLVFHVAGALTSIRAIMEVRTAQGAVAWAVSLNTIPYVAVPAYWVFGKSNFREYVAIRRVHRAELSDFWSDFHGTLALRNLVVAPGHDDVFVTDNIAQLPATRGNDAELLIDGEQTFPSIFNGISRAKDYVLVQFFIIRDDAVGRELRDRLVERAAQGVRCYVLYDEIGARLPKSYLQSLKEAGVQVRPFNPLRGNINRLQINFRNHRKIVIVDGLEAWVGGLNIGDEYRGRDPTVGYWRDTHLRVAGPVVQCVQVGFTEDWHWASKEMISNLNWRPEPASNGAAKTVLAIATGPVDLLETCTLFFLHAINNAKQRLWIATPYFVPDEQFISALQLAALRGVDVRILIPDDSDNLLVDLSAWSYLEDLHKVGIKVYRYTKGFMHQKVMVVDDQFSTIGTANFDNRSFRLNFEITMGVVDSDFTAQVAVMLENDMAHARLVKTDELDDRSGWFRFWVRAARLTAPVQ